MRTDRLGDQRGQATPLVLVVVAFAAVMSVGLVRLGAVEADRAAAQASADAVALAGAADGPGAARTVAEANRAEVLTYRTEGQDAVVTIRRHGVTASARAGWRPATIP